MRALKKIAGLIGALLILASCTKVSDGPTPGASARVTSPAGGASAAATGDLAAAATGGASGATGGATGKNSTTIPHTLRIGDIHDVTSLNPHLATVIGLGYMSEMTMAYLVRYGADNRPIPELATEVPSKQNHLISADGRTIVWHLRRGVKWSDGVAFDGDDVVFSTNVVNNTQNNEVGRDGWDLITKIDQPDKFTVIFHLNKPYSGFLPTFFGSAGANPCILPKHLLGKLSNINNADYNSKPVGIGPFRYVNWVRGDHVEMEANPFYWRGMPKLRKIIYKFIPDRNTLLTQIQTGEVDLWPLVGLGFYDRVKTLKNITTVHSPGLSYSHLDFNESRPIFGERVVREALRYGVDRRTIRDKIQHGLGALQEGSVSPVSPLYTASARIPFNLSKANELLDADGWHRGSDGVRVKNGRRLAFNFVVSTGTPDTDQEVELMRSSWQQMGVQISVQHYATTLLFAPYQEGGILYAGKFDMITFAWQLTPDMDLSVIYGCSQMPPKGENVVHYCNPKAQKFLDAAKVEYAEGERRPTIAAAQKQIIDDVASVVLWVNEEIFSYNSDLKSWKPNSTTPFDDMLNVDMQSSL